MPATTYPDANEWTPAQCDAADAEGWNIWDCNGSENGRTQLCRNDEDEIFPSDDEAWTFVWSQARQGSALHQHALDVVKRHNPTEYKAIAEFGQARDALIDLKLGGTP